MSDAFAQINALLAAAVAQQQKQQSNQQQQQQQNHSSQQSQLGNQFNINTNNQLNNTASNLMNNSNMIGQLNEQSLQSLLYNQSIQQQKSNFPNQYQRQLNNNLLPNQPSFGQMPLLPNEADQFRNENSLFSNQNDNLSNHQNNNNVFNQNQRQSQNELPTRILEPYFSDNESPFSSLEHQLNTGNINRDNNASNQIDIFDQFQKMSLNESMNRNQKMNNQNNHNNSHHNTSSNFDNSIFSLNDSEIYNADQNYMPGTASLIEDVDKQIMVVLRDGRTLIGYLRSIDQYANLLLSSTFERIHVGNKYGDIPKGIYIIRGENVVLIGEVDFKLPVKVDMIKVDIKEILELQKEEQKSQEKEKNQKKALLERCAIPNTDTVLDEYY